MRVHTNSVLKSFVTSTDTDLISDQCFVLLMWAEKCFNYLYPLPDWSDYILKISGFLIIQPTSIMEIELT